MPDPQAESRCTDRRLRRFDRCSADSQNLLPFAAYAVSRPSRLDVAREKHRPDLWSISYPKPSSPGQTRKEATPARLGPTTDGPRKWPWRVRRRSGSGVRRPIWRLRESDREKLRRREPALGAGRDRVRSEPPIYQVARARGSVIPGPALGWLTIRIGASRRERRR